MLNVSPFLEELRGLIIGKLLCMSTLALLLLVGSSPTCSGDQQERVVLVYTDWYRSSGLWPWDDAVLGVGAPGVLRIEEDLSTSRIPLAAKDYWWGGCVSPRGIVYLTQTNEVWGFDGLSWRSWHGTGTDPCGFQGTDMTPDPVEGVWIPCSEGIIRISFDGPLEDYTGVAPRSSQTSQAVVELDGSVWYLSYLRERTPQDLLVGVLDGACGTYPAPRNGAECGVAGKDGLLWFAGYGGVYRFDGQEWTQFTVADGLPSDNVQDIACAPDGSIWIAADGGLARFDGSRWVAFGLESGLPSTKPYSVCITGDGALWALFDPDEVAEGEPSLPILARWDGRRLATGRWDGGPLVQECLKVGAGTDDALWSAFGRPFPTSTLVRYRRGASATFPAPLEDYTWINAMLPDADGSLWAGFRQLVYGYRVYTLAHLIEDEWSYAHYYRDESRDLESLNKIARADEKYLWLFCGGPDPWWPPYLKLMRFDVASSTPWRIPMEYTFASDMAVDLDGSAWLTVIKSWDLQSRGGLLHVSLDGDSEHFDYPEVGGAICVDQDGVKWVTEYPWLDQSGSGVSSGRLFSFVEPSDAQEQPEAPDAIALPAFVDSGGIKWFGGSSRRTLMGFDGDSWHSIDIQGQASTIAEDSYGNLWVSTGDLRVVLSDQSLALSSSCTGSSSTPGLFPRGSRVVFSTSVGYWGPPSEIDLYMAIQQPDGRLAYVALQTAEPAFPIFYAAFDGSTDFLKPGPDYTGPGSMPNTPDMKDSAPPPLPLPDPPAGQGPTGLALFAYPVPYFANVPLPAYSAIEDFVLLNTTLPETAPAGTYTFHIGITAPSSIMNVYRTASTTFEVSAN